MMVHQNKKRVKKPHCTEKSKLKTNKKIKPGWRRICLVIDIKH